MIQDILAEPAWVERLTAEDKRGLNPLFTSNMTAAAATRASSSGAHAGPNQSASCSPAASSRRPRSTSGTTPTITPVDSRQTSTHGLSAGWGATAGVALDWRVGARAFQRQSGLWSCALSAYGIGMVPLAHTVRASAEEGCATFDMLRGDERLKADFDISISREAVVSYRAVRRRSFARLQADAIAGARAVYRHMPPQRRERLRRALGI